MKFELNRKSQDVNVIATMKPLEELKKKDEEVVLLREALEKMTECMEALEVELKAVQASQNPSYRPQYQ